MSVCPYMSEKEQICVVSLISYMNLIVWIANWRLVSNKYFLSGNGIGSNITSTPVYSQTTFFIFTIVGDLKNAQKKKTKTHGIPWTDAF